MRLADCLDRIEAQVRDDFKHRLVEAEIANADGSPATLIRHLAQVIPRVCDLQAGSIPDQLISDLQRYRGSHGSTVLDWLLRQALRQVPTETRTYALSVPENVAMVMAEIYVRSLKKER